MQYQIFGLIRPRIEPGFTIHDNAEYGGTDDTLFENIIYIHACNVNELCIHVCNVNEDIFEDLNNINYFYKPTQHNVTNILMHVLLLSTDGNKIMFLSLWSR